MPAERVHTRVIPGAHGMGKVTVVMKPIKRRSIIPKILGLIVYPIFFAIMFVSFSWSRPHLRFNYTLPAFSKAFQAIDAIKSFISEARYPLEINDKDFTIIGQTSLEDTVRSQGYVHAMERLFQMEIYRRAALGTLSEVFGNRTTYLDVYSRTLDFASMAREDFLSLDAKTQGVLQNYAQGINDYVSREKKATFPLNFDFSVGIWSSLFGGAEKEIDLRDLRPWTAQDSLAVLRMFLYERSHGWEDDILVHMTKELDIITGQSAASLFAQGREQQREGVALLQGLGGLIVAVGAEASASGKSMLAYNYYSTVSCLLIRPLLL